MKAIWLACCACGDYGLLQQEVEGRDAGAQVDYVELISPQEVRLARNRTENRLREKASKRDVAASEQRILSLESRYCCVSEPGEIPYERYLRLDNSALSPEEAAEIIVRHFGYERNKA